MELNLHKQEVKVSLDRISDLINKSSEETFETSTENIDFLKDGQITNLEFRRVDFGYDTKLGEGGNRLSSGQKQKLGLARILLRKAPLILLDEVTSDLDAEVENQICQIIKELAKRSIILNISHNYEMVKESDLVIVMESGKVEAIGKPKDLENSSKCYQNLFLNIEGRKV